MFLCRKHVEGCVCGSSGGLVVSGGGEKEVNVVCVEVGV